MDENQGFHSVDKATFKKSELGKELTKKYTPKKDLGRKATSYIWKHLSLNGIDRFDSCSSWMMHLTNSDMSKKRLYKTDACGNRFCPICTWKQAKKDSIKISVMTEALKVLEQKEFIFLTLTSPNVTGDDLRSEIDKFNAAVRKLFKRRNVAAVVKGYIRKLEVTYSNERYITADMYKNPKRKGYYDRRKLTIGDPNISYDTYNPHLHVILAVNKSYFNDTSSYITQSEWLEMWKDCMGDETITQVDVRKVRDATSGKTSKTNAIKELAKYSAKSNELYHSERVFDTFYGALKKRQLIVYSGIFKEYAKKYEAGKLDNFKETDDAVYTHLFRSIYKNSGYTGKMRELTTEEFEAYNKRANYIEEDDEIE